MSEKLELCPFCGGTTRDGLSNDSDKFIECLVCEACIAGNDATELRTTWNTRPSPWIKIVPGDGKTLPEVQNHKHACGHSNHVWVYYGNLGLPERKKLNIPAGYDTDIYHHPTKSWMSGIKPTYWMPIPELPKTKE